VRDAARLAHICRHPIKSVGFEEIDTADLTAAQPLPFDRLWAVTHVASGIPGNPEGWEPKMRFLRGAAEGGLQAVQARLDPVTQSVTLSHPARPALEASLLREGAAIVDWLRPLWPQTRPEPSHLVRRSDGGALSDVPEPWVSVLSLSSNRVLGKRLGQELSIHRWRGNLWIDGWAPWEEFDLIGRRIAIGATELEIVERITRCVATTANPHTGRADADTLGALESGYGHMDFGVYAKVLRAGRIALGDRVEIAG
jgi:uncharacterized protein YcbX